MKRLLPLLFVTILIGPPASVRGDARPASIAAAAPVTERTRYLMGTLCTAVVESPDTTLARQAIALAFDEIARLEDAMSSWRPGSELTRLNASGDAWFECSADLFAALEAARDCAELTGGSFDVTIEPLNRAWAMRDGGRIPDRDEIERARAQVGWQGLALDPSARRARFSRTGMGVDLGGIGKGFALDRAALGLTTAGFDRALLNFGGELRLLGAGHPVTVADPLDRLRPVIRLEVGDAAVSTSGQSERGVDVKGKHYGHILDPRSGTPARGEGSVTVVAKTGTLADALSTAMFVMGRAQAEAFARARPELGVLWIETAGPKVRAWKWNLSAANVESVAAVEWMN